jgi:uncharacterized 2Fe-2S/4Fe-4S cluster protein (DUF4445 family)
MLLVHSLSGEIHRLIVAEGVSVREALDATDLRVRAACGGTGSCGACRVRWLKGDVNPPGLADYQKLTAEEREAGHRLACQLRLRGDTEILLDHPAPPSHWKSIPPENLAPAPGRLPNLTKHIYGVAVDLGTTHLRVALWNRQRGQRIATRRGPNLQGIFGADVLNRLEAARAQPERAVEMAQLARTAIIQAIRDILARDVGEMTPMLAQIGQVIIVGNTAMLALLTEQGSEALMDPAHWEQPIDCRPCDPVAWQAQWSMPHAEIVVPNPVAGFIGSDLVADLMATRFLEGPPGSLLLDVGTNTEIALWDGQTLRLTATPGGPAFEGVGIRHGMPAEPGAVCRIALGCSGNDFHLETLGGDMARGFCGSGLVDAIAILLTVGVLKPSGRFTTSPGPEGFTLDLHNPHTAIAGSDVDAFQRAKAAMAAAMAELLRLAGLDWGDIQRLCVCGAFGRYLNIAHAQAVGLLPAIDPTAIELHAEASLAGCERALLAGLGATGFATLTKNAQVFNLSFIEGYEDRYIDHLRLRPVPPVG